MTFIDVQSLFQLNNKEKTEENRSLTLINITEDLYTGPLVSLRYPVNAPVENDANMIVGNI